MLNTDIHTQHNRNYYYMVIFKNSFKTTYENNKHMEYIYQLPMER